MRRRRWRIGLGHVDRIDPDPAGDKAGTRHGRSGVGARDGDRDGVGDKDGDEDRVTEDRVTGSTGRTEGEGFPIDVDVEVLCDGGSNSTKDSTPASESSSSDSSSVSESNKSTTSLINTWWSVAIFEAQCGLI